MNNDFNKIFNEKLEELNDEKINNKINYCDKKIGELKIPNEVIVKKLQGNIDSSNKAINNLEKNKSF